MLKIGAIYGLKVWLFTVFLTPFLYEAQRLILNYGKGNYKLWDLLEVEPLIYLFVTISVMIFFLLPCLFGGMLLGFIGTKKIIAKTPIGLVFFGLLITILGYGLFWLLLLSKRESYWVEFLTTLGLQTFLWAWAINRFNLWFKQNNR